MVRTELREHIFKMLFQIEFNTLEEMPKHLELYFEELTSAKEKDKEYIQKKLEAVIEKLEEIDAILNEKATGWKTSRGQTFFRIVLPQMVKNVLPSVTNEVITLVKDTSLVYSLSYIEMFAVAKQIAAAQTTVLPFFIAGVYYYIFNYVVAGVMELFEKKLNYYH